MSARCKHCGCPLTDVARLIADVTALLDMDVPLPEYLSLSERLSAIGSPVERDHTSRAARMGAAQYTATAALAVAHGFCSARCAAARPKNATKRQETR
jgi:hypothetical protein